MLGQQIHTNSNEYISIVSTCASSCAGSEKMSTCWWLAGWFKTCVEPAFVIAGCLSLLVGSGHCQRGLFLNWRHSAGETLSVTRVSPSLVDNYYMFTNLTTKGNKPQLLPNIRYATFHGLDATKQHVWRVDHAVNVSTLFPLLILTSYACCFLTFMQDWGLFHTLCH